jgi:hypothetical protein
MIYLYILVPMYLPTHQPTLHILVRTIYFYLPCQIRIIAPYLIVVLLHFYTIAYYTFILAILIHLTNSDATATLQTQWDTGYHFSSGVIGFSAGVRVKFDFSAGVLTFLLLLHQNQRLKFYFSKSKYNT